MAGQALAIAQMMARYYMDHFGSGLADDELLVRATLAGYLAGSGVPTDEAVRLEEQISVQGLVSPASRNPMYHGVPWIVPGPVSGAPYYPE